MFGRNFFSLSLSHESIENASLLIAIYKYYIKKCKFSVIKINIRKISSTT